MVKSDTGLVEVPLRLPDCGEAEEGEEAVTAQSGEDDETDDHAGRHPDALCKTEGEIAAPVGVSVDKWRPIAKVLKKSGLPQRDPLFGKRRYWPAVRAFLDRWNGIGMQAVPRSDPSLENWDKTPRKALARKR